MTARVDFAYSLRDQMPLNARMCRLLYGPIGRPAMVLLSAVIPGAAVAIAGVAAAILAPDYFLIVFALLGLALAVPAIVLNRRLNLAWARRASNARTLDGALCVLEARPEYLLWTGPDWRSEIAWSGIDLIDDGPKAVMLVFRGQGYFAPRRAFADDAARAAFLAECAKYLTPEARRKSGMA